MDWGCICGAYQPRIRSNLNDVRCLMIFKNPYGGFIENVSVNFSKFFILNFISTNCSAQSLVLKEFALFMLIGTDYKIDK